VAYKAVEMELGAVLNGSLVSDVSAPGSLVSDVSAPVYDVVAGGAEKKESSK